LFEELENKELTHPLFAVEVESLLEDNPQLRFTQIFRKYEFDSTDGILLLRFCNLFVENGDDTIRFYDLEDYFPRHDFRSVKSSLQSKSNILFEKDLIKCNYDDGFEDCSSFRLTDKAKDELLGELNLQIRKMNRGKDILEHESLAVKQLYYNPKEQKQVAQLTGLLREENFIDVQKRLKEKGMRTGFACLFYGAPGTGKTETVYQIARQTKRNLYMVDISETKSMWFGESEKRIKEVFEKYKALVKSEKTTPILLFNEADAVIGKRKDTASGNCAQTENAIQNIILQEMENLKGIMIATTNLTQNLDKAFERRFLYKIEFEKPCVEARKMIWLTMIPSLSIQEAEELAITYDFSGGQIENIARKRTVDNILNGTEPSLKDTHTYCRNELLYKKERKSIGFNVQ
ncbi:MAG: ATP-binding protein, partial [Bacteroidales bacterium]|nr:ATP-binding protein [Bacteroidales bacterium]